MRWIRNHLTYSNATATLALFIALGGASYAAVSLPANSVGTRQIKDHAVTMVKVARSTQTALHGARGPRGAPGIPGRNGAAIVARARSTGTVHTPTDGSFVTVPLTSNTWKQDTSDIDIGPLGSVTFTAPDASSCGGTGTASLYIEVDLDGQLWSTSLPGSVLNGSTRTIRFGGAGFVYQPSTALTHTATVKVDSACSDVVGSPDFTISDLRFAVVRAS